MSKRIIEGRWDCSYCNTKRILGRYRECPNCGNPRGKEVKFYLLDEKDYIPDEQAETINTNPDWICEYCGSYNSDNLDKCESCGAERSSKNYFDVQKEQEKKKEQTYNSEKVNLADGKSFYKSFETEGNAALNEGNDVGGIMDWFKVIISLLIFCIFIYGLVHAFSPKTISMKITGFSWERSIIVEEYKTFHESDWNVPEGAKVTSQNREICYYDEILDHYETKTRQVEKSRISHYKTRTSTKDLGNGYFEESTYQEPVYETYYETETYQEPIYRDEPVYKIKYYYDIDRWVYEKSIKSKGNNQKPYWKKVNLNAREKASKRKAKYMVSGITDEKKAKDRTVKVNFAKWKEMKIGQTIKIKVYVGGRTKLIE